MKMFAGGLKGIGAAFVVWLTYLNNTFTPLFWVLIALVALDLFLNVHKEGQQFPKIISMAVSLGFPSYVAANLGSPYLGKYIVAILCLAYIQVLYPAIVAKLSSIKFSKDPKENAIDQAAILDLMKRLENMEQTKAQNLLAAAKQETAAAAAPAQPSVIEEPKGGA